jgi:hypothetical protein
VPIDPLGHVGVAGFRRRDEDAGTSHRLEREAALPTPRAAEYQERRSNRPDPPSKTG